MNQKWIALLLALILALSVCGCAADQAADGDCRKRPRLWKLRQPRGKVR